MSQNTYYYRSVPSPKTHSIPPPSAAPLFNATGYISPDQRPMMPAESAPIPMASPNYYVSQPVFLADQQQPQHLQPQPYQVQFINTPYASPQQRRRFRGGGSMGSSHSAASSLDSPFHGGNEDTQFSPLDSVSPNNSPPPRAPYTGSTSPSNSKSMGGKAIINVSEMKAPRTRRRIGKTMNDIKYPMNYPAHFIPERMQKPTVFPNDGSEVHPPKMEDIKSRRYATGVDERNFLTVLEYEVNNQTIIWDFFTGYVHLTGIWKAVGHPKADIVRLLDNSPEIEPLIKRVRGGFLKIQGTWVPYDVAQKLAARVCYYIRFALVPLFGEDFPDQCMKPDEPGFGMLQLNYPRTASHGKPAFGINAPANPAPRLLKKIQPQLKPKDPRELTEQREREQREQREQLDQHPMPHQHPMQQQQQHLSPLVPSPLVPSPLVPNAPFSVPNSAPINQPAYPVNSGSSVRPRVNSTPGTAIPFSDRSNRSIIDGYDEDVFEDEEGEYISPPPMPRKVSFKNEEKISESTSEILAMLKATRSLQQMSTGRPVKDIGGGFECGGKQFIWDGSDKLDVIGMNHGCRKPEPTPPIDESQHAKPDPRMPTLTTILNM